MTRARACRRGLGCVRVRLAWRRLFLPQQYCRYVCVGARQAGRERAVNVVDAPPRGDAILEAMEEAVGRRLADVRSPYGDGHAAERILSAILEAPDRNTLLRKRTTILAEDVRTSQDDGTNR